MDIEITASTINSDTWEDCLEAWLGSYKSSETRRAYKAAIEDFKDATGISLDKANRRDVGRWFTAMRNRRLKNSTIQVRISALSSFYNFAEQEYTLTQPDGTAISLLQQANPAGGKAYRVKQSSYGQSRFLSKEETRDLLMAVNMQSIRGKRDYALLLGYVILGRRNSEWRLARVIDFEERNGKKYFRWSGKGHEDELLEVPKEVWQALSNYIQVSGERGLYDYIFLSSKRSAPLSMRGVGLLVMRYARKAGIPGRLRVHDLRHTAAMLRRAAGADVVELQQFLGHASLATTQVYLHRLEGVDDQRAAQVAALLNIDSVSAETEGVSYAKSS